MTGAALQALAVVGRQRGAATRRAVGWLRANQNDDGGFGQFEGRSSNAQSTAYAVQGLRRRRRRAAPRSRARSATCAASSTATAASPTRRPATRRRSG